MNSGRPGTASLARPPGPGPEADELAFDVGVPAIVSPDFGQRPLAEHPTGHRTSGRPGYRELVLEVVDLTAAEDFYSRVLGLPVVERWAEREAIWVMAGSRTRIGLWRPQVGTAQGRGGVHVHYAMHLPADAYDAAVARLRQHGLSIEEDQLREGSRAIYVHDPDGNVVELCTWDVAGHLREAAG